MATRTKNDIAWLRRFYPKAATYLNVTDKSWLMAVRHSIRKWQGLNRSTLADYGLQKSDDLIQDMWGNVVLNIDGESCALCVKSRPDGCDICPVCLMRDTACDDTSVSADVSSEYHEWVDRGHTEPMLKLLRKVERWLKTKKGRKACR